jgi:hypothetical protein
MEMKLETTTNTSVSKLKTYADLSFSSYIDLPRQKTKWKDIDWNRVLEGDICAGISSTYDAKLESKLYDFYFCR